MLNRGLIVLIFIPNVSSANTKARASSNKPIPHKSPHSKALRQDLAETVDKSAAVQKKNNEDSIHMCIISTSFYGY
jgi:hypothetical protein